MVIENYNSASTYQQWYVLESSFPEYYYIVNSTATDPFMKVVAGGNYAIDPLHLEPMSSS